MIRNGKKKAISCALVAAMSVGLAACGTTSYDFKVSYDGIKTYNTIYILNFIKLFYIN